MTGPYPPPSNQPGDGAWQGGDINSPFGFSDATAAPNSEPNRSETEESSPYEGVQYELEAPAGQQPGYNPATGPVTGVPMTGPPMTGPPGYPPQQAGYSQPPPFGQPGMPPPSSGGGSGWLIGGVVAGVVILLAVAAVIVVITAGSDDDPGGDTADPGTEQPTDDPGGDEPSDDPGGDDPVASGGEYVVQEGVCDELAMDTFADQDPGPDSFDENGYDQRVDCTRTTDAGDLYITLESFPDEASAQDDFETTSDIWLSSRESLSEPDGPWQTLVLGEEGDPTTGNNFALTLVAVDGNLVVMINWYAFGTTGNQQGASEAALAAVEDIMQVTSA